jgi:tetratricopeptide (TPR) repeat protein
MSTSLTHVGRRVDDFVYTRMIKLFGGGPEAYMRLSSRYESLGWFEEAAENYKKVIKLHPEQAPFRLQFAQFLFRMERLSDASALCQEALQLDADLAPAYVLQGTLYLKTGDQEKALHCFRQAMTRPLNDATAYHTIAKAFAGAELYEEAALAYREIIRISPRNVAAYGIMAETYSKLNRFPEALEAYRQAVELQPSADAYGILASAYARVRNYREAVLAYQQAMKLEPGFSQTWNRLSEIYIKLEDFEKRTSGGQSDEQLQKAYAKLRKEQEALENFKEYIRQKPDDPGAYLQMGQLYLELSLPAKAMDFLKHALRLKATGAAIHRSLGLAYMGLNEHEKAHRAYKEALRAQKNDADTWCGIGQLSMRLGKHDEAIKAFIEAIRWKPQDGSLHRQLGDIFRQLGRFSEATRAYWQAIHLNPQDGAARYGLGVTYVRLGQRSYALEQNAILKTVDAKLAADLNHVIWQLSRTPKT